MAYSSLVQVPTIPLDPDTGLPDLGGAIVVSRGLVNPVLHIAPDGIAPAPGTLLGGGADTPWTWGSFAAQSPTLALACQPHEWSGEQTASDVQANDARFWQPPETI